MRKELIKFINNLDQGQVEMFICQLRCTEGLFRKMEIEQTVKCKVSDDGRGCLGCWLENMERYNQECKNK